MPMHLPLRRCGAEGLPNLDGARGLAAPLGQEDRPALGQPAPLLGQPAALDALEHLVQGTRQPVADPPLPNAQELSKVLRARA